MNSSIATRLNKMLNDIESGWIRTIVAEYPGSLESSIQKAVSYKRDGNYDSAIDVYLRMFEGEGKVWVDIEVFLYKVLLADCDFAEAYRLIVHSERAVVREKGPLCTMMSPWGQPMGRVPWMQTDHKERFISAMRAAARGDISIIKQYCESASGNYSYRFRLSDYEVRSIANSLSI